MSSCEDIVAALEGISAAIGASGSSTGGSSAGCGCIADGDTDVTEFNDGEGEEVPEGETFPEGFTDRADFDEYRCKAAQYLIDNYVGTLRNWAGLTGMLGGLTLAVITGVALLTVPPIGLALILASLGILVSIDIELLVSLSSIADGVEDDSELLCEVYSAGSSAAAAQAIRDSASEVIDGLALSIPDTYKQITDNLISNNQADILVNRDPAIDELPSADCSGCDTTAFEIELFDPLEIGDTGTLDQTGTHYTLTSTLNAGRQSVNIHAIAPGDPLTPRCFIIENIEVTGALHVSYLDNWYPCGDGEFSEFASGSMLEAEGLCAHGFILQGDPESPFTVEFDAVTGCEP